MIFQAQKNLDDGADVDRADLSRLRSGWLQFSYLWHWQKKPAASGPTSYLRVVFIGTLQLQCSEINGSKA